MSEVKNTIDTLGRKFEEFKTANDERLKQIERTGTADAALVTKVENLNAAITELENLKGRLEAVENRANRPALGRGGREMSAQAEEHRDAFLNFMRKGTDDGLGELEVKAALRTSTADDGGHLVPAEVDRVILGRLSTVSPMRQLANVVTVGRGYKKLVNRGGATSGWVGEEDDRGGTDTPKLAALEPFFGEIYANPAATQTMLDDTDTDVEAWLADEVEMEFAEQEGPAFVSGDGVKKPKGYLAYDKSAAGDKARAFQVLQFIATGAAASLGAAPGDKLIDVVQSLNARLRNGARWSMNGMTVGAVRKIKDSEGNYLWQPGLKEGESSLLLGYGISEDDVMPDIAADAFPIAFANWKRGYKITDRVGIRVLRDPFSNKPYIHFYTTRRVGGYVEDANAIKLLKIAA